MQKLPPAESCKSVIWTDGGSVLTWQLLQQFNLNTISVTWLCAGIIYIQQIALLVQYKLDFIKTLIYISTDWDYQTIKRSMTCKHLQSGHSSGLSPASDNISYFLICNIFNICAFVLHGAAVIFTFIFLLSPCSSTQSQDSLMLPMWKFRCLYMCIYQIITSLTNHQPFFIIINRWK